LFILLESPLAVGTILGAGYPFMRLVRAQNDVLGFGKSIIALGFSHISRIPDKITP